MTGEEQRAELVSYWWAKAVESLSSAQRETDADSYGFAVNRLYFTLFYAVSAALLERGQAYKKHSGVRAAFHREFIKTGLLDVKWGKLYDQLFEDRQEADYIAWIVFDRDYVEMQLQQCTDLLDVLRPFVDFNNAG
jgi:uncharacterized protein (UPF0332 family)